MVLQFTRLISGEWPSSQVTVQIAIFSYPFLADGELMSPMTGNFYTVFEAW